LRTRLLAPFFAWNVAAACACALELGVPAEAIVERTATFSAVPGRFEVVPTPGGPTFILDTVKAPFYTLDLAFSAFGALPAKRKCIVIGQISDSKNPRKTYRDAYKAAREAADRVLMVGDWSHRSQASEEDIASGRFHAFQEPADVFRLLKDTATPDDLIFIKASTTQHLERIALAWDEDVRCWKANCGLSTPCLACGLYNHPFESHKRLRRKANRRKQFSKLVQWLPSFGAVAKS
jgi:UDP-N-acetylmuramoyl-tripeptide--D-alanyl-D-alanine ligase